MNTIVKNIPNTITCGNFLCGAVGIVFAFEGRLELSFVMMLAAAVCDFCDGLAARLLNAYSDVGKELDSLSDVVSFGLLPSIMLSMLYVDAVGPALGLFPLLLGCFSALRLAKFNIDERQHESFLGLPTPASAIICGSLASFVSMTPDSFLASWCAGKWFLPLLTLVLCLLVVSDVPMFSMKFGTGKETPKREKEKRQLFVSCALLSVVLTLALEARWPFFLLLCFLSYVLVNLVFALIPDRQK